MFEPLGKVLDGSGDFRVDRVFGTAGRRGMVGLVQNQHCA